MKRQYAHVADGILRNRGNILRVGLNSVHTVTRTCEVNRMSDLIERQAAINAMAQALWLYPNEYYRNLNVYAFAKGLAEIGLRNVPSAQPALQWIPVTERLPEENGTYLACYEDATVLLDWFNGKWFFYRQSACREETGTIIAWMPLPEPYREDGGE